jgi:hypothetical protein
MSRDIEATITELEKLLPYVARDAERYRNPTELVTKSHELHLAARAIDETLPHPSLASLAKGPFIRVHIGTRAVEALGLRKLPYDFVETTFETAEPGEAYNLLYKKRVSTDIFNPLHSQPIYGHIKYFDLATLGRILEDGGELSPSERAS